jgi:hypothetical protein
MKNADDYKRLLAKYGQEESIWDPPDKHLLVLQYLEYYEKKFEKKIWFPDAENTQKHFFGKVDFNRTEPVNNESRGFYFDRVKEILEFPWLSLRFWGAGGSIIIDNILISIQNSWYGKEQIIAKAYDFTHSIKETKIGRQDEHNEKVYFCNGLVVRTDGTYKFIHAAFRHPEGTGFGDRRFGLSYSAGNLHLESRSWIHGLDLHIPSYYKSIEYEDKRDIKVKHIRLHPGFPKKGEMVTANQKSKLLPGYKPTNGFTNPANEYSIYNEDLDPFYKNIYELT